MTIKSETLAQLLQDEAYRLSVESQAEKHRTDLTQDLKDSAFRYQGHGTSFEENLVLNDLAIGNFTITGLDGNQRPVAAHDESECHLRTLQLTIGEQAFTLKMIVQRDLTRSSNALCVQRWCVDHDDTRSFIEAHPVVCHQVIERVFLRSRPDITCQSKPLSAETIRHLKSLVEGAEQQQETGVEETTLSP